jgi:DNA repair exonuclease SbcCD ATPase subunit
MLKKPSIVVLAILFSSLFLLGPISLADQDLEQKVDSLAKSVSNLEDTVKDLSFQLQQTQAMTDIIKEISYQLKQDESSIRDLQSVNQKIDNLSPKILNLEGTLQGLAASLNEKNSVLQGRVFDLETSVQGLDARLKGVEGNVMELLKLPGVIDKLTDRVNALEDFKDHLAKMPSGSPEEMAKLMASFDAMRTDVNTQIGSLTDRVSSVEQQMNGLPIAAIQSKVESSSNRISVLETNKAETSDVDALKAQVAKLQSDLSAEVTNARAQEQQNMIIAGLGLAVGAVALASAFGVFK